MKIFTKKTKPKPFVKWAGGKRQIVNLLVAYMPKNYETYIEPFVGGGALFFQVQPRKAIIGDINQELINAYLVIKDHVEDLIEDLKMHKNTPEYYYRIRAIDPKSLDPIKRASRFIYLNKTCYNGLYRENSKGEFNVPFGRYKNPKIVDEENLKAVSEFLRSCDLEVLCGDFEETCKKAKAGDFVYFDPPYYSTFSNYTKENFTEKDHIRLRDLFVELDKKGVYLMLTNSNTDFIKNLYKGYRIEVVNTARFINCKGDMRGKGEHELIITNY
ncbi:DNA adenine methylase [Hydrogenobacter sp. T-2]|nr:DNA adenine methylase [Hydrogenobacter sp. T-2]WPM32062.1 DNA adenine methylase [Hydrogenobacter sp. T-2]